MPEDDEDFSAEMFKPQLDTPLEDYEPILLDKDSIEKTITLIFDIEDPYQLKVEELGGLMVQDKSIVRGKYGLPPEMLLHDNPGEYYRQIIKIGQETGVELRDIREFAGFFQQRIATAVHMGGNNTIAMNLLKDNDGVDSAVSKARTLEHETIHALQLSKYPQMSLIRREYEAYIASANERFLKQEPWLFLERVNLSVMPEQLDSMWNEYQQNREANIISKNS